MPFYVSTCRFSSFLSYKDLEKDKYKGAKDVKERPTELTKPDFTNASDQSHVFILLNIEEGRDY